MAFTGILGIDDSQLGSLQPGLSGAEPVVAHTTQNDASYGQAPYGQTPYGGRSVESSVPVLASADPAVDSEGAAQDATVAFTITCPIDLDPYSLSVKVDGYHIIAGGGWIVEDYGGTIAISGTSGTVTIATHPQFANNNEVELEVSIRNLAGETANLTYAFTVGFETLDFAETLTLAEGLVVLDAKGVSGNESFSQSEALVARPAFKVNRTETLTRFESVQASVFNVVPLNGRTLQVTFPEEFQLEGAAKLAHFTFEPLNGGVPLVVTKVVPTFDSVASGSDGRVVPHAKAYGEAEFSTTNGVSFLTDTMANFTEVGLSAGDTVEVETAVDGRMSYTVVEVTSDTTLTVSPTLSGTATAYYRVNDHPSKPSKFIRRPSFEANPSHLGDHLTFTSTLNAVENVRIAEILNPYTVRVETPLLVDGSATAAWVHKSGVSGATFTTSESTNGKRYRFSARNLRTKAFGYPFSGSKDFTAISEKPKLAGVSFLADGTVLVDFNEDMRFDEALPSPAEYSITGPSTVTIHQVTAVSPSRVALKTAGMEAGSYTLTVNASGTPKDVAGNPIDPAFNTAIFTASTPQLIRSVFTDKGPIAKPAEVVQSGSGVTLHTYTSPIFGASMSFTSDEVTLTGGAFVADHVGLVLYISGTENNDGGYRIVGLVGSAPTARVRLQASFQLPDANNGSGTWELVDPRDGQIADDPADVTVRINGTPVTPEAVVGLLGQVILPSTPGADDDVKIDYAWVPNPVVDFRRLNSREFVLNNWAYDAGQRTPSQHHYRYRTVLVTPDSYVADDIQAPLAEPQERQVHYRAYERAYSALLNDPALLLLNTPNHRISYAPLQRLVSEVSVSYGADTLPEADPVAPWERKGSGPASVLSGVLSIDDNTSGPYPGGNPLFWQRDVDLSFDHVFAATWRMTIPTVTTVEGVFTGVAFGWANDTRAVVLGYLEENGVKKLGILKSGLGNNPSGADAWGGGLDAFGSGTGTAAAFDWSILHSYRFFRGKDGVVRLYVDGEIQELLRVTEDELPFLSELNAPFDALQGVFFGSISRPARTVSTWDFVRYVVLPTNPEQTEPSVLVSYEGNVLPEAATQAWTPVGYHGNERILNGRLLLSSTSATDPAEEVNIGVVGGDFRAMSRVEPLLSVAADVALDAKLKILSQTHGVAPNAAMVAIDDGQRLVQLSLFPYSGQPKLSYPGRSLPEDATPLAWTAVGTATAEMLGRTLRLTDAGSNGIAYEAVDSAAADSTSRILGSLPNYAYEFRALVRSYEADVTGFCGVTASVYDELRSIGVRFVRTVASSALVTGSGTPSGTTWVDSTKNFVTLGVAAGDELQVGATTYAIANVSATVLTLNVAVPISGAYTVKKATRRVEFHSNGQPLAVPKAWDFDWFDGELHTVRVVKSSSDGATVLNGFLGSIAHHNTSTGISRFTDSATSLASVQVGDHIVIQSGLSTGAYPVTALVSATTVEINGLPVQSSGVVWSVQRGRNMTVSLLVDDELVGSADYDAFTTSAGAAPTASFGSTIGGVDSRSVVDWAYFNVWRTSAPTHKYVGLWKGFDDDKLTGYYLPTKASGGASVTHTASSTTYLTDMAASFIVAGVAAGDHLVVDDGPNKGVYDVISVSATQVGVKPTMPVVPTQIAYRIAKTVDWSTDHHYRIVRDPAGSVALFIDGATAPVIRIPYNEVTLPSSSAGVPSGVHSRMPSITWGSLDPANLSQTDWAFVRYAITRSPTEDRVIPPHQVLDQRNVMSSPEHLLGSVPHEHTQHTVSSTGIPHPWREFSENTLVEAFTKVNEGTPIVPMTQTYEVRRPTPVYKPVSSLNTPSDVLNSDKDFLLNDATLKVELLVPNDVLYSSLEMVEKTDGELNLLEPFADTGMMSIGPINYTKDICLHYDGTVLPEDDSAAPTPWAIAAEDSATYSATALNGLLTYTAQGGQTLYRNDTPLTDPASLDTEVTFRFTVLNDATTGTGDSGIRMGFSAFGLTAALAFVTTPLGDREVRLLDLNTNEVLGSIFFDYLDGVAHTYRLKKNVEEGAIEFTID